MPFPSVMNFFITGVRWIFQGRNYGYASSGTGNPAATRPMLRIDKFPFAADTNASAVGDLIVARAFGAGQSSESHGYVSGGSGPGYPIYNDQIEKFPFAADTNASDVGNLTLKRWQMSGQSSILQGYGYTSGGFQNTTPPASVTNRIDKFPFAADTNASDVANLSAPMRYQSGQSSESHGYSSGSLAPWSSTIDKFPFAADTNASSVGNLTNASAPSGGQSSRYYGYSSGGYTAPTAYLDVIERFPFASDGAAKDVGALSTIRSYTAGQSSRWYGYATGGTHTPGNYVDTIDKFPFASGVTANDIGNLTGTTSSSTGQQY